LTYLEVAGKGKKKGKKRKKGRRTVESLFFPHLGACWKERFQKGEGKKRKKKKKGRALPVADALSCSRALPKGSTAVWLRKGKSQGRGRKEGEKRKKGRQLASPPT